MQQSVKGAAEARAYCRICEPGPKWGMPQPEHRASTRHLQQSQTAQGPPPSAMRARRLHGCAAPAGAHAAAAAAGAGGSCRRTFTGASRPPLGLPAAPLPGDGCTGLEKAPKSSPAESPGRAPAPAPRACALGGCQRALRGAVRDGLWFPGPMRSGVRPRSARAGPRALRVPLMLLTPPRGALEPLRDLRPGQAPASSAASGSSHYL